MNISISNINRTNLLWHLGLLAALAIGRCLQLLRETGMTEGISLTASGAIREASLRLSAAIRRPEEILSALEYAAATLSTAEETHPEAYKAAVQTAMPAVRNEQVVPSSLLCVGR